jgi:transcription-repair coupling factor (superfamily II helicase)
VEILLSSADRDALTRALSGGPARFEAVPASSQAAVAWALHAASGRTVLWVTDGPRSLDILVQDLESLAPAGAERVGVFPAREASAGPARGRAPDVTGDRLDVLRRCRSAPPPPVIATCIQALLQPTVDADRVDRDAFEMKVGDGGGPSALVARLEAAGYEFVPQVDAKGQASLRGGIVDVWPPNAAWPSRVEFLGEEVESIRTFDPWEQRSRERVPSLVLAPAREEAGAAGLTLLDYLPADAVRVWNEPARLREHAEMHERAEGGGRTPNIEHRTPNIEHRTSNIEGRNQHPTSNTQHPTSNSQQPTANPERGTRNPEPPSPRTPGPPHPAPAYDRLRAPRGGADLEFVSFGECEEVPVRLGLRPVEPMPGLSDGSRRGGLVEPDVLAARRAERVRELAARVRRGGAVWFLFATAGARDRFRELYADDPHWPPGARVRVGALSEGFELEDGSLTVVAEGDLFPRRAARGRYDLHAKRPGPRRTEGERFLDAGQMEPGELVVHVEHGVGRYLGLLEIEIAGRTQEALAVEYAENAKLYVPVGQAHLLSRYVGIGGRRPELHKIGGRRWTSEKEAAERAIRDLAGSLLETQALRQTRPGHAFAADGAWQHELEAAFPYHETEDQLRAIADVKRDMEAPRPMDRLICGDVGYGKTEVAMRAAFKAVMDGRQVAVLVPTTVLAQQHHDTFCERMAAFPVTVDMLSRFRTRMEQRRTIERLRDGKVDIVIGTHRLVQPDVSFRDLGLVVIDEEQRFGVEHKEALKRLRSAVDVLTMTATPIPRTLYFGLTGARDLSVIQTPPQERLPVETIVRPWDEALVRDAILRELDREGQVFFLHNRVMTILDRLESLRRLVPEARIEAGHGQMNEGDLADLMHRFTAGEIDVLLCTTIIESGVDIPRVNTILIERAERFGMADLYQLRGRVGRYKHQAYAYLLLPRHGRLLDTARQRIVALRRHSGLGAGFRLALRDLETRGAGNLLGAEQSGHIAAVGFDLYCQLLRRTVARLKGEASPAPATARLALDFIDLSPDPLAAGGAAVIPTDYVEDEVQRLHFYRRLAGACAESDVRELAAELRDRFGPLPAPLDRLLRLARLRIIASARGIESVETEGDRAILMRRGEPVISGGRIPRLRAKSIGAKLDELLKLVAGA